MPKHFFLVLEGMDGSGKSYLSKALQKYIDQDQDIQRYFENQVLFTFEPGGYDLPFGQEIRKLLFSFKNNISPLTESLLFLAGRSEHVRTKIRPLAMSNGLIVCDRFFLSTLAYQSFCGKVSVKWLQDTMEQLAEGLEPDLICYLNITKETYLERYRSKEASDEHNSFDKAHRSYEKMQDAYEASVSYLTLNNQKFISLNTEDDLQHNVAQLVNAIKEHMFKNP